eukprot:GGOE01001938.1.p1 GENE.GGOE01001938.1~~GGOE01001938.1.p1  ORF type:complete len:251 (+),score=64.36 GGOE01001938.1:77-754(+)
MAAWPLNPPLDDERQRLALVVPGLPNMALIVRAEHQSITDAAEDFLRAPEGAIYQAACQTAHQRWVRRMQSQDGDLDIAAEPDQDMEPNPFLLDASADSSPWPGADDAVDFSASVRYSPKSSFALKASQSRRQLIPVAPTEEEKEEEEAAQAPESLQQEEGGGGAQLPLPSRLNADLQAEVCSMCHVCRVCCICDQTIRGRIARKRAKNLSSPTPTSQVADGQPA